MIQKLISVIVDTFALLFYKAISYNLKKASFPRKLALVFYS